MEGRDAAGTRDDVSRSGPLRWFPGDHQREQRSFVSGSDLPNDDKEQRRSAWRSPDRFGVRSGWETPHALVRCSLTSNRFLWGFNKFTLDGKAKSKNGALAELASGKNSTPMRLDDGFGDG